MWGLLWRVIIDFPVISYVILQVIQAFVFYTGFWKIVFGNSLLVCLSQERLEAKEKGESTKDDGPRLSHKELETAEKVSKYNVSSVKSSCFSTHILQYGTNIHITGKKFEIVLVSVFLLLLFDQKYSKIIYFGVAHY